MHSITACSSETTVNLQAFVASDWAKAFGWNKFKENKISIEKKTATLSLN
jgi:hypothetical protein